MERLFKIKEVNWVLICSLPIVIIFTRLNYFLGNLFLIIFTGLITFLISIYIFYLLKNEEGKIIEKKILHASLLLSVIIFTVLITVSFVEVIGNRFLFRIDSLNYYCIITHIIYLFAYSIMMVVIWMNMYKSSG